MSPVDQLLQQFADTAADIRQHPADVGPDTAKAVADLLAIAAGSPNMPSLLAGAALGVVRAWRAEHPQQQRPEAVAA